MKCPKCGSHERERDAMLGPVAIRCLGCGHTFEECGGSGCHREPEYEVTSTNGVIVPMCDLHALEMGLLETVESVNKIE